MITFEEAKYIAEKQIPSHHSLIEIIEKPYGWYFTSQTKAYIESGDFRQMDVGSGGFIVEKANGQIVGFSSAYSSEENFKIYEAGISNKSCDLTITKVRDLNLAIRLLKKLSMTFVKSEFEHNIEWKIPKEFNEKQLKEILQNLPYTFTNQNFYFRYKEFEEMSKSNALEYELKANKK